MAKFVYRMQNILDIKYKLETQAKSEYAVAANRLRNEEKKLQCLNEEILGYEEKIRLNSLNTVNVENLKWFSNAISIKKDNVKKQIEVIEIAKKELELARIKLSDVMIDRKTHEKLKEKAFEEFKHEISDTEMKEIDELVSYNFNKAE